MNERIRACEDRGEALLIGLMPCHVDVPAAGGPALDRAPDKAIANDRKTECTPFLGVAYGLDDCPQALFWVVPPDGNEERSGLVQTAGLEQFAPQCKIT